MKFILTVSYVIESSKYGGKSDWDPSGLIFCNI